MSITEEADAIVARITNDRLNDQQRRSLDPLKLFDAGLNTYQISVCMGLSEAQVCRLLQNKRAENREWQV